MAFIFLLFFIGCLKTPIGISPKWASIANIKKKIETAKNLEKKILEARGKKQENRFRGKRQEARSKRIDLEARGKKQEARE
ncbi:MAG: hypothetical protein IJ562_10165 [Prevotella sp.]|nr:hypothetical protein [Prevotella sp.]